MIEELKNRFGAHRVLEAPKVEGKMPLLILDLELESPVTVLMTNGLRDYKMPLPEKLEGREYNELYFCLPSYWEWENLDNANMNWIYHWIERLCNHVVNKETWFGPGHTMPCKTDSSQGGLSNTMKQNHFMLVDPLLLEQELQPIQVGDKTVHFLGIMPLFKDEVDYKLNQGTAKFLQKARSRSLTEKLDDFRSTILKSKWRLRR